LSLWTIANATYGMSRAAAAGAIGGQDLPQFLHYQVLEETVEL
jgi:hypothetical protein